MRRLFWMIFLLGTYFWILTSGREQWLVNNGKALYQTAMEWLEDADADFQLKKLHEKKKSRRWD
ncbi:MAG: hypothetical protein KGJ02_03985 [Verrucomicrobiota bacterium]|nr:hypothetical protein [Verrucomicrobiota bacterium]